MLCFDKLTGEHSNKNTFNFVLFFSFHRDTQIFNFLTRFPQTSITAVNKHVLDYVDNAGTPKKVL